jgi:hypothetical protein
LRHSTDKDFRKNIFSYYFNFTFHNLEVWKEATPFHSIGESTGLCSQPCLMLWTLLFADDFLVRLKHEGELVCMLQVLCAELSKVGVELFLCQNVNVPHTGDECSRCGHSTVNLLMQRKPIASTNALEENTMVLCRFPQALLGTSFIGNEIVVPGTTGSRVLARNQGTHRGSSESNK